MKIFSFSQTFGSSRELRVNFLQLWPSKGPTKRPDPHVRGVLIPSRVSFDYDILAETEAADELFEAGWQHRSTSWEAHVAGGFAGPVPAANWAALRTQSHPESEQRFTGSQSGAAAIAGAVASMPVTVAPRRAIGSASRPPPQPISNTRNPATGEAAPVG